MKPGGVYVEFREDGWPLCPRCGLDELYTVASWPGIDARPPLEWFLEQIEGCYACDWKPGAPTVAGWQ